VIQADDVVAAFRDETGHELAVRRSRRAAQLVPELETVQRFGPFGIVVGRAGETEAPLCWRYGDAVDLLIWPGAHLGELDALLRRITGAA
jgi:hypothetical protein